MADRHHTATSGIQTTTTFVSGAAARLRHVTMRHWCNTGLSDEALEKRSDDEDQTVEGIAQAHAATPQEVLEKLRILCGRIRTHLSPAYEGEVIDYMLAEGARADLEAWILRAGDADADRMLLDEIERLEKLRAELVEAKGPEIARLAALTSSTEQGIVERAAYTPAGVLWKARRLSQLLDDNEGVTEFMRLLAATVADGLEEIERLHAGRAAQ